MLFYRSTDISTESLVRPSRWSGKAVENLSRTTDNLILKPVKTYLLFVLKRYLLIFSGRYAPLVGILKVIPFGGNPRGSMGHLVAIWIPFVNLWGIPMF